MSRTVYRVLGVEGHLVLGRFTHETLLVGKGHEGGGDPVALVVGDDLHLAVLPDTHARERRAQVDADCGAAHLEHQAPRCFLQVEIFKTSIS